MKSLITNHDTPIELSTMNFTGEPEPMPKPQHTNPCSECPFNRMIKPGALGGSEPEKYVGQACGPFFLPCHSTHNYKSLESRLDQSNPQCAGAAIFRANVGVAARMPAQLLHLDADRNRVFSTFEEFYAHHKGITFEEAAYRLRITSPEQHMRIQFEKALARSKQGVATITPTTPKG